MARRQLPWSGIGSRRVAATVTPGNIGRREVTMRSCGTAPILAFANIPEPVSQDCRAGRHEPIVRSGPPPGTGKNAWTKRFKIQSGTIGQNVPAEVTRAGNGAAARPRRNAGPPGTMAFGMGRRRHRTISSWPAVMPAAGGAAAGFPAVEAATDWRRFILRWTMTWAADGGAGPAAHRGLSSHTRDSRFALATPGPTPYGTPAFGAPALL